MKDQDKATKVDRMRYIKNKFSSNMCLLAILFDVFYFVCLYKSEKYCYLPIFLGIMQFVRIFVIPLRAATTVVTISKVEQIVMGSGQFAKCIIYLCVSGVCCLFAAGVGIVRSRTLKAYLATLGEEVRRD